MKVVCFIPARYASTRFPGKPLVEICGSPMIEWVYKAATSSKMFDEVYVLTENEKITSACDSLGLKWIMTSTSHVNGTERVAEAASRVEADLYVTLQGDEPLIETENIKELISLMVDGIDCAFLKTKYTNPIDVVNGTTPKVVCDKWDNVLYMSRSPIPYPKESIGFDYYKPMGQYAFRKNTLDLYRNLPRGSLEAIEDIELLRLVEAGVKIKTKLVESDTIAVDTVKDFLRVTDYIKNRRYK